MKSLLKLDVSKRSEWLSTGKEKKIKKSMKLKTGSFKISIKLINFYPDRFVKEKRLDANRNELTSLHTAYEKITRGHYE